MLDALIVADMKFSGGTANAIISDVRAFQKMGLRIGILPVTSGFFSGTDDRLNPSLLALADHEHVEFIATTSPVRARNVFFHHPLTFFHGFKEKVEIKTEKAVLVTHHPPFRGDGSLEYDPIKTNANLKSAHGITPIWAPVSGEIRRHLRSFAPLISLSNEDWVNAFDGADWKSNRPVFSGSVPCVGRHSRADMLKWSDQSETIMMPLGYGLSGWRTKVMGYPAAELESLDLKTDDWDILDFNQEPVDTFLDSLDVFSYFYNDLWVEAFGRTIAEAILMERPCVLDSRLESTFGKLATYAKPHEVPACLERFGEKPEQSRKLAKDARARFLEDYSIDSVAVRYARLNKDSGTQSRTGPKFASPTTTMRKLIGLHRRRFFVSLDEAL